MSAITIRNLPEETHLALKRRAAQNGRSTEAEVRDILRQAVLPIQEAQYGLGSLLMRSISLEDRLFGKDLDTFMNAVDRNQSPLQPIDFD